MPSTPLLPFPFVSDLAGPRHSAPTARVCLPLRRQATPDPSIRSLAANPVLDVAVRVIPIRCLDMTALCCRAHSGRDLTSTPHTPRPFLPLPCLTYPLRDAARPSLAPCAASAYHLSTILDEQPNPELPTHLSAGALRCKTVRAQPLPCCRPFPTPRLHRVPVPCIHPRAAGSSQCSS